MPRAWRVKSIVGAGIVSLTVALGAGADVYRYETDEGTISYTDDEQRVPARYRESMERIPPKRLRDYSRFTPVETRPLDSWGRDAQSPIAATEPTERTATEIALELAPGIRMDLRSEDGEPIRVVRRSSWEGGGIRRWLEVRRGDEVLAVIDLSGGTRFYP